MNRTTRFVLIAVILVVGVVFARNFFKAPFGSMDSPKPLEYSQFLDKVDQGKVVQSGTFRKSHFEGKYFPSAPGNTDRNRNFIVYIPNYGQTIQDLQKELRAKGVSFTFAPDSQWDTIGSYLLPGLIPLIALFVFWLLVLRPAQSGNNQAFMFTRARHRRVSENVPKVTFDDVAGVEEAKQDLQEIVEFLSNAKRFQALGAKIPKGVLLLGPPGSGKTLLARAIAGEARVPFFHISGSDFVEMFVGVGASRVRDLFETAKQNRPALIFIDEIDAVGRQRGAGWGGGHDEREQTLNQLLVEMDGFDPNAGVILIAATNRPDVLDPALLRPGRFDRRVVVDAPDQKGREAILGIHTRGKPLADDVRIEDLARRTPGLSGAELANLVNEAALLAARRDKTRIEMNDFEDAIDRQFMGPARSSRVMPEKVRRRTAYHESGHAIVGELLANADPVYKVTIVPRGMALGVTLALPAEERYSMTKSEMEDRIAWAMGGRIAELIIYNELDAGAFGDLQQATSIARAMVCEYGMSERLGNRQVGKRHGSPFLGRDGVTEERDYSDEVAKIVDEEIHAIIDRNYQRAEEILKANRAILESVTEALMEKETLDRPDFLALMQGAVVPSIGGRTPETPKTPPTPPASPETVETEESAPVKRPTPRPRLEPGMA